MDALGTTELVKRQYGICWHCVFHVEHQNGRKRHSSVSVSTGTQEKRKARRGFCLLSLHGAPQDSQYSGKTPRALCSVSRGGTRIGRKRRMFLWSLQLQILFFNLSERSFPLSQRTLDEDCIWRIGGRWGKERGKEVRKRGPVLRVFTYCKGREGDVRAGGERDFCWASWSHLKGADEHGHLRKIRSPASNA